MDTGDVSVADVPVKCLGRESHRKQEFSFPTTKIIFVSVFVPSESPSFTPVSCGLGNSFCTPWESQTVDLRWVGRPVSEKEFVLS